MPSSALSPSLRLKCNKTCLRVFRQSAWGTGRGEPCFSLVPQYRQTQLGLADEDTCGWLRGWDRSIKGTDVVPSGPTHLQTTSKGRQHDDRASATESNPAGSLPSAQPANPRRGEPQSVRSNGHNRKHDPPLAKQSSSDDMLRKAGMHSWESDRGVWQVGGGKRRRLTGAGLKAPKRQLKPVERTRRAGEEGLYLTSGREGVRQQQDNDTTVEEGGIVSSKTTPPSVEPANAKGNSLPQKIVNDTNSKLVGNMISKVAIKIQQADGSVFVFRKKGSKSHAGKWQLPSAIVMNHAAPLVAVATICRGLLRPRSQGSDQRLFWGASTFVCGKRLGRPIVVLVFEAVVNKEDVVPARAALGDGDFMWVSAEQYASMSKGVAEVLMKRCPWRLLRYSKQKRFFTTRPQLQAVSEAEKQAFSEDEKAGLVDHGFVSLNLHEDAKLFRSFTQRSLLHVVSTAVWDNVNKKVLVASRRHKIDRRKAKIEANSEVVVGKKANRGKKTNEEINVKYEERWEFPGGKVEIGESHTQAAARELKEELDVSIQIEDMHIASFLSYPWYDRNLVRTLFTVEAFSGQVKSKEQQKFKWLGLEELKKLRAKFMTGDCVFVDWVVEHYKDQK